MAQSMGDSLRSTLAGGRDGYRSDLADGSDSFSSTLDAGNDYIFEDGCDLCERDGLQKEAVGYCVDCQDYLCTECFRNHLKPKPSRHHVLLDQQQMPSRKAKKICETHVVDINVRSKDDKYAPVISGSVVPSGDTFVVVDYYNHKVKLIDLIHSSIVSQLKLPGDIWDITRVGSTQVAVTSFDRHTIYFVNFKAKKLKLDRKVKVNGRCQGITSINDKLVVSYDGPAKVEIISMVGDVLQTVVTEDIMRRLFIEPKYVAVSRDQQTIYISDRSRCTVTSVDLTGQVQATYKDDKLLRGPRGLTVDSAGRVYVCGETSRNILQLTSDLTEVQELLQLPSGIVRPKSVYYCEVSERLYIGMDGSDVVKVYQME